MPEIKPFAAIRYDHQRLGGDLSSVLAPPYDVLDESDKKALLARSAQNIIAVDLPHLPPKSAGPSEAYAGAARKLQSWLNDGTLIQDTAPALYLYHQTFEHQGGLYTRRMVFARLRLSHFSEGQILPHEETFGGPKEDRLALMKATRCQLSPIFGLYSDPDDVVGVAFTPTVQRTPDVKAGLNGVTNKMWIVADAAVCEAVRRHIATEQVYIADGHHRYGTALMYRDWYAEAHGDLSADHPVNFVMFVLASMDDPGCLILPYYRSIANVHIDTLLEAWGGATQPASGTDADLILCDGADGKRVGIKFTARGHLRELEPDQCEPWYDLDYAYLHCYLIDELLASAIKSEPQVRYVKSAELAMQTARNEQGVALLTNATPMAHLRAVSEAGGLMPQKSTYFHPKLVTGLAINPLK